MRTVSRYFATRPNARRMVSVLVLTGGLFVLGCSPAKAADYNNKDLNTLQLTEYAD
jgi:hypothetical protein